MFSGLAEPLTPFPSLPSISPYVPPPEPATRLKALAEKAAADAGRRPRGLESAVPWVCVEGNFHSRNKLLRHRLLGQVW
ncbi:hypothetical protein CLOP_g17440 [Closterium sp. NIES-67]|nr:hypothetical protein CLOP_g17440 [Closterium sp. NIES-67]